MKLKLFKKEIIVIAFLVLFVFLLNYADAQKQYCNTTSIENNANCGYIAQEQDEGINEFYIFICEKYGDYPCYGFVNGSFFVCARDEDGKCQDSIDNDCDGRTDFDDSDCPSYCVPGQRRVCFPEVEDFVCNYYEACNSSRIWDSYCVLGDCDLSCSNGDTKHCPRQLGVCVGSTQICENGQWQNCNYESIEAYSSEEICGDYLDNDCNGLVDEGCSCSEGDILSCGSEIGICDYGIQECENGNWSFSCSGEILPLIEECDSIDNDCDGSIDEGCGCSVVGEGAQRDCGSLDCGQGKQTCVNKNGELVWGDCLNDRVPRLEICNDVDDDCDNAIDEGCSCNTGDTRDCGSGVGACTNGKQECVNGLWSGCLGSVSAVDEICDDNIDNDCDGSVDEGCECVDGDIRDCSKQDGVCFDSNQTCVGGSWQECSYTEHSSSYENKERSCGDNLDNDCDGLLDLQDLDCPQPTSRCSDDTLYGECSVNKPKYCSAGVLENKCALCGCNEDEVCKPDGRCVKKERKAVCGDGKCELDESCSSCSQDCGECSEDIDTDKDGLSDFKESLIGTNPNNPDTDFDAYNDKEDLFPLCDEDGICESDLEYAEDENNCPADCLIKERKIWPFVLFIILIILIGFVGYMYFYPKNKVRVYLEEKYNKLFKKKKKPKEKTTMLTGYKRLEQIYNYVDVNLRKGKKEKEIIDSLVKAGWDKREVEDAIKKVKQSMRRL